MTVRDRKWDARHIGTVVNVAEGRVFIRSPGCACPPKSWPPATPTGCARTCALVVVGSVLGGLGHGRTA